MVYTKVVVPKVTPLDIKTKGYLSTKKHLSK